MQPEQNPKHNDQNSNPANDASDQLKDANLPRGSGGFRKVSYKTEPKFDSRLNSLVFRAANPATGIGSALNPTSDTVKVLIMTTKDLTSAERETLKAIDGLSDVHCLTPNIYSASLDLKNSRPLADSNLVSYVEASGKMGLH